MESKTHIYAPKEAIAMPDNVDVLAFYPLG